MVKENEAEQVSRPIILNVGKYRRKARQLLYPGMTWLAIRQSQRVIHLCEWKIDLKNFSRKMVKKF